MLTFTYTARDSKSGERVIADIEAENETSAAKILIERGLTPLEILPKNQASSLSLGGHSHKVKAKDRVVFSRQLSTLINAGLPLVQSLDTIRSQVKSKSLQEILRKVISDVEAGQTLAEALAKYPLVFNNVYVSLVAAGESSGTLDKSLERLANQQEKDAEVLSKVRGAMIYPIIVLLVLFGIMMFMVTTVLPQVQNLYKTIPNAHLPLVTTVLISVSTLILHFWWLTILLIVFGFFFSRRVLRSPAGRLAADRLKLTMWPVAPLFSKLYMARFARTGSTLLGSGVPMLKMLEITSDAVGNGLIAHSITGAIEKVKGGKPLSVALQGDPHFLDLVPNMIHVGEQSGALEDMLGKVADYYEKEVDNQVKAISTIVEPVMMIAVGILALIIVAGVLLPIYSLAGKNLGA